MDQALLTPGRAHELWQLRQELLASNPLALLDWEASRHYSGWVQASAFYVQDADDIGVRRGNDGLRQTSVITWLYLLASFLVDRERCAQGDGRVFIEYLMQVPARGTALLRRGHASGPTPAGDVLCHPPRRGCRAGAFAARPHLQLRRGRPSVRRHPPPDPGRAGGAEGRRSAARSTQTLPALVGNLLAPFKARTPN
jgi:hypothetical protein